jgi:hypothetical protein
MSLALQPSSSHLIRVSELTASISALEARLEAHNVGTLDTVSAREEVLLLRGQLQEKDVRLLLVLLTCS